MLGKTPQETMFKNVLRPYLKQISNNWCHIFSGEKALISDSTEFKPDNERKSNRGANLGT